MEFYGNLNTNVLTENMTLIDKNKIISKDKQIAKIFSKYFLCIPILNMPTNKEFEYSD